MRSDGCTGTTVAPGPFLRGTIIAAAAATAAVVVSATSNPAAATGRRRSSRCRCSSRP